jgi:hypothetical protein
LNRPGIPRCPAPQKNPPRAEERHAEVQFDWKIKLHVLKELEKSARLDAEDYPSCHRGATEERISTFSESKKRKINFPPFIFHNNSPAKVRRCAEQFSKSRRPPKMPFCDFLKIAREADRRVVVERISEILNSGEQILFRES